jgi:CubicO group peptidase (beta-lactamase class C family)
VVNEGSAGAAAVAALERAVDAGETPGGVLAAGWGAETELLFAYGWAETGERQREVTTATLFDLASLTKVVGTLPVVLHLVGEGRLALGSRASELLPGFGAAPEERARMTVEHLLTHTSGLPPFRDYWKLGLEAGELRCRLLEEPLESPPGERVAYSDIGFLVLGWLAEAVTGRHLDELVADWVASPLGLARTRYGPVRPSDAAATEKGYRVGVVHDETAAALGAPVGHAGLFSTAADLGAYLGAWLSSGQEWLPSELRASALTDRTAALGGHRGLGWVARGDAFDQLGESWPGTAVSHTGFTGTSLALDPPSGRWVVLLTNDVHYGRGRGTIRALRMAVHEALAP